MTTLLMAGGTAAQMLARWTNDRWAAAIHRVCNDGLATDRKLTLGMFTNVRPPDHPPPPSFHHGAAAKQRLLKGGATASQLSQVKPETLIEALPTCIPPGHLPKFGPVTTR